MIQELIKPRTEGLNLLNFKACSGIDPIVVTGYEGPEDYAGKF